MEQLQFEDGRAVVALPDTRWLSIINVDREPLIREAMTAERAANPFIGMFTPEEQQEEVLHVAADDESWEVALIDDDGCVMEVEPEFAAYRDTVRSSPNWLIYGNVPIGVVEQWITDHEGRPVPPGGVAGLNVASPGGVWQAVAWRALARPGGARHGKAWQAWVGFGGARQGMVWRDQARQGQARSGKACQGKVGHGLAGQAGAWSGGARRALAGQGKPRHGAAWPGETRHG